MAYPSILGISIAAFTALHVIISLVGIVSGIIALIAMLNGRAPAAWTALFLATTVFTSVTGFLSLHQLHAGASVGAVSLVLLAVTLFAFLRSGACLGRGAGFMC